MSRASRSGWRRPGFYVRWLFALGAGLVIATVLWVLALAVVPPRASLNQSLRVLEGQDVRQSWRPLSEIAPDLSLAVMAGEDTKFCQHTGFDLESMRDAVEDYRAGGSLRGASTISQQVAKNVFLWNGGGFVRKAAEAWFTLLIETFWSKPRIMEAYLNVAEWGGGRFGAEAAARFHFGVSASELSQRQAALLASVLPSPNKWNAGRPGPYVSRRAGTLQARMATMRRSGAGSCVN